MTHGKRRAARSRSAAAAVLLILLGGMMMFGCFGCMGRRYAVDYCGEKDWYKGAKDAYRAGTQVTLHCEFIATDTNYSFYLDGEPLLPDYDDRRGFILRFTMPEHDVKLECVTRNTMVYVPEPETKETKETEETPEE